MTAWPEHGYTKVMKFMNPKECHDRSAAFCVYLMRKRSISGPFSKA